MGREMPLSWSWSRSWSEEKDIHRQPCICLDSENNHAIPSHSLTIQTSYGRTYVRTYVREYLSKLALVRDHEYSMHIQYSYNVKSPNSVVKSICP